MEAALEADDLDAWAAADERFHRQLVEPVGNRRLAEVVHRTSGTARTARAWSRCACARSPSNSTREHMGGGRRRSAPATRRRRATATARTANAARAS